ncbi:RNB-domain-containing protein [Jackrogersella minutella]|nr:RNB-domain-containing protein [Jackrogersella minutella]
MLRTTSNMSYVCWRCASQRATSNLVRSDTRVLLRAKHPLWRRNLATTVHGPTSNEDDSKSHTEAPVQQNKIRIRERLRIWDQEHQDPVKAMLSDFADAGELSNTITRPQNVSMATFEVAEPLFDGDELGDLRSEDANLHPGDMVELCSEGSRRPMLAICLGRVNGYEHYYTSSGKWFTGLGVRTLFVVHNFATPDEFMPVASELPAGEIPLETLNALQDLGHNPSRSVGAPLLRKMLSFSQRAEEVYQANAATLDSSSAFIGDAEKAKYLTLHEITELLLPKSYKIDGKFEPKALYAVHRALMQDEVFFRPLRQTGHGRSYLFEVSPLSDVNIVRKTEEMVRSYQETITRLSTGQGGEPGPMFSFIERARKLIDQSRENRPWTDAGIIGPSKATEPASVSPADEWSETDLQLLQFIELWASYQNFPNYSRLQCYGSTILRALDRYQDAENLSASTGWTFLQEVGWIPNWEIPARYNVRFPGINIKRGGGYIRPFSGSFESHLKNDALASIRKDWDGVTAYCIDSEATVDIDDAVSVERTSNPDEYWIHVHVADPASSILAETPIAKYAELLPETIYLPGHFERMLPPSLGQERFSLGPDRPCLTFSALVRKDGVVVDSKVTPGILKDVVYMTGENVALAIEDDRADPVVSDREIKIGSVPTTQPPVRRMTLPKELKPNQKEELALLSELGRTIQNQRLIKGAVPFFQPRAQAQAYFDHIPKGEDLDNFMSLMGDPSIHVAYSRREGTDLVENCMKLVNEVAAQWCHQRGIPIPFRSQPHAVKNADILQKYADEVFYPLIRAGIRPSDDQWRHLRSLVGSDEITTTAGPHFSLGVSMYTKVTSPLRRFSDLIVHWQIEAALLEEHRRGTSLVGNTNGRYLPFSRDRLDRMLPMIRLREKQSRTLANGTGGDQWILQALVRAWRFGEADLPETFQFSVVHLQGRRSVLGKLDWFERAALLRPDAMNDIITMNDIRVGDVYEVKLKDVNVHANRILVEAVRVIKRKKDAEAASGVDLAAAVATEATQPV